MKLRLATRASPLALVQTQSVLDRLADCHPSLDMEIVRIQTAGDRDLQAPISEIGGKAVFASALEQALLADEADIAVHSAKDLSAVLPEGLVIGAVPARISALDVLVGAESLDDLSAGARIATGAVRRKVQLQNLRQDLEFFELRGNIETRLSRLEEFDAVLVAKAALVRLELNPEPSFEFSLKQMVPQVGQGCLAVEYASHRTELAEILEGINDAPSCQALMAERSFLKELGGDCNLPAGAYAFYEDSGSGGKKSDSAFQIEGILAHTAFQPALNPKPADSPQFPNIIRSGLTAKPGEAPAQLGERLARELLADPRLID